MAETACRSGGSGPGCCCLPEADWKQLFDQVLADAYTGPETPPTEPLEAPVTYLVGGQPGSRKTSMVGKPLAQELAAAERPFVHYDFDNQRPLHPRAAETFPDTLAAEADPVKQRGRACVDEDIRRCLVAMHEWARERGIDIISEGAFENAKYIGEHIAGPDRAAGRQIDLRYIATPDYASWTGVLKRGVDAYAATGSGRLNPRGFHDGTYGDIPGAANRCQTEGLADVLTVLNSSGRPTYVNRRVGGSWMRSTPVGDAITRERDRLRTPKETKGLLGTLRALDNNPATTAHLGATWRTERDATLALALPRLHPATADSLLSRRTREPAWQAGGGFRPPIPTRNAATRPRSRVTGAR